ncbi:SRPBCC family protein [Micromonospora sp. NPDC002575]|uniref:SRPBCC family protein n=1 Tax=Micromonospora sp. NPDC002575 TaxID=3364222 RepID=UPI00368CAF32
MIEIGARIDLPHPTDRVWRALTDPALLARWYTEVEPAAGRPGRLLLYTAGLPGFDAAVDAEVTERREPDAIALRCQEAGRRTLLSCAVSPTPEGCRLTVRETLEHGAWPVEQRVRREQFYQQTLTGRLPAILDWLAFQQVDLLRDQGPPTAEMPVVETPGGAASPRRRRRAALVAALGGGVLATGLTAWVLLPPGPDRAAAPQPATVPPVATTAASGTPRATPTARPTPSATRSSARPSRSAPPTPSPTPTPAPATQAPLTARYETVATRIFGYTGEVVVDNAAGAAARDWTVVLTLPSGSTIGDVEGGEWRQDGRSVTITGPAVPAGGSQSVRFDVRDADPFVKAPEACAVADTPCAGL